MTSSYIKGSTRPRSERRLTAHSRWCRVPGVGRAEVGARACANGRAWNVMIVVAAVAVAAAAAAAAVDVAGMVGGGGGGGGGGGSGGGGSGGILWWRPL
jgi:hypothetical protein